MLEALPLLAAGVDPWIQPTDPLGWWLLSTIAAGAPVLVLLGLIGSGWANAWQSAVAGLLTALGIAIGVFEMPLDLATGAVGYGLVFAVFRIVWLIVAAVFLYDLAVETGQFEVMKASIARLSGDRRIQALLIAFAFGAFIEGAAGFGAPVAISAAFLVGLGFRPFQAAVLCLIANTAPVAWGAIGTPIRALAGVTSLDVEALSQCAGRILPFASLIVPVWLVRTMVGWRETFAIWPALLVIGGTFAATQFAWSNWVGYELVDIAASVASLVAGVFLLRRWRPAEEWRFPEERGIAIAPELVGPPRRAVARAWMPFGLLSVAVLIWGLPPVRAALDARTSWKAPMPGLTTVPPNGPHFDPTSASTTPIYQSRIGRGPAVTGGEKFARLDPKDVTLDLVPVTSTGTAIFLAAVVSGVLLGVRPRRMALLFVSTAWRLRWAMVAILAMLALGFVTKFSGMDVVMGLAFTRVGPGLYPIFGTMLGWLGVALTGSDTSSNVLFGGLQKLTAEKLGLNPILMASANSTGGVMGKMIDAQSIVVAAAATGEVGQEGRILRAVLGHSVALALLVGGIVWVYAHLLPGAVPSPSEVEPVAGASN